MNHNAYDFANLLLESIERFTYTDYEIIIVDNSMPTQRLAARKLLVLPQPTNIGHGAGLNLGVRATTGADVMVVDIDCHFLRPHWEYHFQRLLRRVDLVAGKGVPVKPIRPSCMFMKRWTAVKYDWQSTPGYHGERITPAAEGHMDVAIKAYGKMVADGLHVELIDAKPSSYKTINGEDWCIDGIPLCYHHWSGTWLNARQCDFPDQDLQADKAKLFASIPWRAP